MRSRKRRGKNEILEGYDETWGEKKGPISGTNYIARHARVARDTVDRPAGRMRSPLGSARPDKLNHSLYIKPNFGAGPISQPVPCVRARAMGGRAGGVEVIEVGCYRKLRRRSHPRVIGGGGRG